MNNNMLPIGTMLRGGTYQITKHLNNGGFGNTYVVENVFFHETYVAKEFFMRGINKRTGTSVSISQEDNKQTFESQKEKFKKEAQRIRKLNHACIVRIFDLFEDNDTYYYIMDYIEGESLEDWLKHHGTMPESEALNVTRNILDALSVVHSAGLTHMDIKPSNILRDLKGGIYLIDFGASKQMTNDERHTLTTNTAMPYTPGYAPTEQIEGDIKKVGPWTDLYALGATLYRLLTNNKPPSSSDITDHLSGQSSDPFSFSNSISESTRSLIRWMMQPGRGKRPQSANEVIQKLKNSENGLASDNKKDNEDTILNNINGTQTVVSANRNETQTVVSTTIINDKSLSSRNRIIMGISIILLCLLYILIKKPWNGGSIIEPDPFEEYQPVPVDTAAVVACFDDFVYELTAEDSITLMVEGGGTLDAEAVAALVEYKKAVAIDEALQAEFDRLNPAPAEEAPAQ